MENILEQTGADQKQEIKEGDSVIFLVNAPNHPFWITTDSSGIENPVTDPSASNNSAEISIVSWRPSTSGTYYYICENHDSMHGQIIVT